MISLACAALLLGSQNQESPRKPDPSIARPIPKFDIPASRIQAAGLTFQYKSDTELGAYIPHAESGDVWKSIQTVANGPTTFQRQKLRVKIYLLSESLTIGRHKGKYLADRVTLVGPEREALNNVLTQYAALIRASGFEPELSFTEDDDLIVLNDLSQGPAVVSSVLAPHINDQAFASDDPTDRGPFDVILALTSSPLSEIWNGPLDESVFSLIPLSRVSPQLLDVDLAAYLYNATCWQLKSAPLTNRLIVRSPVTQTSVVPTVDLTLAASKAPQGRMPAPDIKPLPAESQLHAKPIDTTAVLLPDSTLAVTGSGEIIVNAILAGPQAPSLTDPTRGLDVQGRVWRIFKVSGATSIGGVLGFSAPITILGEKSVPATGELPREYKPYGHFRETQPLTSLNPIPDTFSHFGFQNKGGIEIISRKQIPVIEPTTSKAFRYTIQTDDQDVLAFMFYGKTGNLLKVAQISGIEQNAPWTLTRQLFSGKAPQSGEISLADVKEPIFRVVLGVPPFATPSSRVIPEIKTVEIRSISIHPNISATSVADLPTEWDLFDNNAPNAKLEELSKSGNPLLAIAALGVLSDQPVDSQAEFFGLLSRDASTSVTWLANKSLAKLTGPAVEAQIAETLRLGPFDFNRRCAALAAKPVAGKDFLDLGNFLLVARSWQTRAEGARLISWTKSDIAQTYLVSSLSDPSPNVRGLIAGHLDPNVILSARRLLYYAVNDSSEDIRAICYTNLLTSKDENFVSEALAGIKDESRLVRLAILSRIMAKPDEKFRGTFRIAVLDRDPIIQALVLKGFADLPEKVELGEVANTIGSKDIPVQIALLQLAKTKKLTLPPAELTRLAASETKAVSDLAKEIQGGNR